MTLSREEVKSLGRLLAARSGQGRTEKPLLRLITPPKPSLLDQLAREAHVRRIVHLQKAYRLQWLVDQATFKVASLSCLEDEALIRLHREVERARQCIVDGVSFEDAGLVHSVEGDVEIGTLDDRAAERQAELAEMAVEKLRRSANEELPPAVGDTPF